MSHPLVSIVVPLFNEEAAIAPFHASLIHELNATSSITYEIIYCDDGSTDNTVAIIASMQKQTPTVRLISFSRNFGKEYALTAGIKEAQGEAILTIDGDGQHPVTRIKDFITAWQEGAQVVIGVREKKNHRKDMTSRLFYSLFNRFTDQTLIPGSTDFRLIDREVAVAFLQLDENNRITRGLIDWLGFTRVMIPFTSKDREHGTAAYGTRQLIRLAINSFVSLSPVPLYIFGYVGVGISLLNALLGITIIIEQLILGDPMHWHFTGTAMLAILVLFLVGIVLISQGILSLYVSRIHSQSKNRPLYIINHRRSIGLDKRG